MATSSSEQFFADLFVLGDSSETAKRIAALVSDPPTVTENDFRYFKEGKYLLDGGHLKVGTVRGICVPHQILCRRGPCVESFSCRQISGGARMKPC